MERVYGKSEALLKVGNKYCPGCFHSMANKLVAQSIEELGLREKATGIIAVGCANLSQLYYNFDMIGASHGRAPAVATGFKRMAPDRFVFCYQGDGDLASIGLAETVHAANRGEHIAIIFINNSTYGMTGGQMAPTTLVGQNNPKNVMQAKKNIKKSFELQMENKGYTFVELLSSCPTNWNMTPPAAAEWMNEHTIKYFPLGVYKDTYHVMEE